jgi:murein DD-endopeptidase MepM/ murein hydrolase activator NlpD
MLLLALAIVALAYLLAMTAKPTRDFQVDLAKLKGRSRLPLTHLDVTSEFGSRDWPLNPDETDFHTGIDFRASPGTQVFTVADGWIEFAGVTTLDCEPDGSWRWGYGLAVTVNHGAFTTLYAHLQSINPHLEKGRQVLKGELLGYTGRTGCATGPHLHYALGWNPGRLVPGDPFAGFGVGDPRLQGRPGYWVNPRLLIDGDAIPA